MEYLEFVFDHKTIRGFKDGTSRNDIVLFVHGFMGNKVDHHFMMRTFSDVVIQCGFSSYRFDFLGSGDSDGNFAKDERCHDKYTGLSKEDNSNGRSG